MLSPQKAADKAGVSRATITNAIKSERLRARRGNEGRWLISPEALEAWMTGRPTVSKADTEDVSALIEVAVLRSQLTKSEEEVTRLREQLEKVETKAKAEKAEMEQKLADVDAERREAQRRRSLREIIFG